MAAAERGLTAILFGVDDQRKARFHERWPGTMLIVDHWGS